MTPVYAELQVTSNFSFLRGASHPEELVAEAAYLGLKAIAVTDRNGVSGVVRAHTAAKAAGLPFIPGCRLDLADAPSVLCLPTDHGAWTRLCALLTLGKRRAPKGECELYLDDLMGDFAAGQILILIPPDDLDDESAVARFHAAARHLKPVCRGLYTAASRRFQPGDRARLNRIAALGGEAMAPMVATNDVHAHAARRRPLQDVLTCIREGCSIHDAGFRLHAHAERHLKPAAEMARLFADHPAAVRRTLEIAAACTFSLDELRYEYPADPVASGLSPQAELERLVTIGMARHYPDGVPEKVAAQIEHELTLIGELSFAPYFLTVHDLVRFARSRGILCQGRGSAANSAVCYVLGVTAVDPARIDVLFERFISAERGEPPDIDIDFESGRREEVIQYVYETYGRDRAAMTATVICYRTKGALRDAGKALGLSDDIIVAMQKVYWRRSWDEVTDDDVRDAGLDPGAHGIRLLRTVAGELRGFPRHLSQHTGGMVMTAGPVSDLAPVANAAMADRTVIEWDKNDLDALGILKVDILGLGMLTAIKKSFDLIAVHHGRPLNLANVPPEDPAVYDMLCTGDSVGVFQVESRAQMSMLPRLKPRNFYDLVIEVAIVRPGPIQGDMVHPYLRRRDGTEQVSYPSAELEAVLGKTLGVPLFQEQAMKIAIVGAGFTPAEADQLRRALATFRRLGDIRQFEERFIAGMTARGYDADFAGRCFRQIEGFADYGFPESHAASFALLVYVSSWLKRHYPATFCCALLNSQPMGFYAPAQLVRDAREHDVRVMAPDVNMSDWETILVPDAPGGENPEAAAVRLGLHQIKGLHEADGERLMTLRAASGGAFRAMTELQPLGRPALEKLARADAFRSLGLDRRAALWAVRGLEDTAPLPLFADTPRPEEAPVSLPLMNLGEHVADDYRTMRLSLKAHPLELLRRTLGGEGYLPCERLADLKPDALVSVAGLVVTRQRPGSAKGVMFVTLEDETGIANLVVWSAVLEKFRAVALGASLMGVHGTLQREGEVIHVVARRLVDETRRLRILDDPLAHSDPLRTRSRDFQ
ncbi:MAG: error-prone DNA polymerase [Rhodospirillales bacterium]